MEILQRSYKQDLERFLVSLNIEMLAKSKKVELNEEFITMWREEQSLWDVMSPLYRDRNEKDKSLKRMSDKFQISGMIFSNTVLFQMRKNFSAYPGDSAYSFTDMMQGFQRCNHNLLK